MKNNVNILIQPFGQIPAFESASGAKMFGIINFAIILILSLCLFQFITNFTFIFPNYH